MLRLRSSFAFVIAMAMTSVLHAQGGPEGALTGFVVDPSDAALAGVTVTATSQATGEVRRAVTSAEGLFRLPSLPVGAYSVQFERHGFKPRNVSHVLVEAAMPQEMTIALEVGGLSEELSVTAEQPVIVTNTAAVARQLSGLELVRVPSSTRNFTHLLTATAGVSSDLPPVQSNDAGSISPSVNGAKFTSNSVVYNGVDMTSMLSNSGSLDEGLVPAPETIEEVKLQTALYDAATGRSGGGNFQLVTKAGANAVHGSVYGFGQHEALNANDFFFEKAGLEKPRARRSEAGFTLGGPLKRDRVFFFGSFQYTDAETGYVPTASSRALVPAALALISGERTAQNLVAAFRQLNPNFRLTASQISPLALQLLNARNPVTGDFLIPSAPGRPVRTDPTVNIGGAFGSIGGDPLAELRQVVPSEFRQYQGSGRLDVLVSQANRLSASYFYGDFPSLDQFPDPSTLVSPFTLRRSNRGQVASLSDTHFFDGGAYNTLRAGLFTLRNTRTLDDPFLSPELSSAAFGIDNPALQFDDSPGTRRLGHFVDRGATWSFGGGNDSANRREQRTLHLSNVYTRSWRSHQVSVGGEFKRHDIKTNLPEEQATEFEKIENWQHFL
ncbi:MAG TPA: carboxypeptidase-like regulatory domain-containing protein, partial [Vicinamibacteria bacterium]